MPVLGVGSWRRYEQGNKLMPWKNYARPVEHRAYSSILIVFGDDAQQIPS